VRTRLRHVQPTEDIQLPEYVLKRLAVAQGGVGAVRSTSPLPAIAEDAGPTPAPSATAAPSGTGSGSPKGQRPDRSEGGATTSSKRTRVSGDGGSAGRPPSPGTEAEGAPNGAASATSSGVTSTAPAAEPAGAPPEPAAETPVTPSPGASPRWLLI